MAVVIHKESLFSFFFVPKEITSLGILYRNNLIFDGKMNIDLHM